MPIVHPSAHTVDNTLTATEYSANHEINNNLLDLGSGSTLRFGSDINIWDAESNIIQTNDNVKIDAILYVDRIEPYDSGYLTLLSGANDVQVGYGGAPKDLIVWGTLKIGDNDTNLYRSGANVLKTDDNFSISGDERALLLTSDSYGEATIKLTDRFYIDSPKIIRFRGTGGETLELGADVNLYRNAANQLKTDDKFYATQIVLSDAFGVDVSGDTVRFYDWGASAFMAYFNKDNFKIYGTLDVSSKKIINVANPTTNQDAATKSYVDGYSKGSIATREIFATPNYGTEVGAYIGHPGYIINATNDLAYIEFMVPWDYGSTDLISLVVISKQTKTHRLNINAYPATHGEDANVGADTAYDIDTAITQEFVSTIDISNAFTFISAGDYVGVEIFGDSVNTPNLIVIGLKFKYLS